MQLTINLPDILSQEKKSQLIKEIEKILLSEGISYDIQQEVQKDEEDFYNVEEVIAEYNQIHGTEFTIENLRNWY